MSESAETGRLGQDQQPASQPASHSHLRIHFDTTETPAARDHHLN
jgi:hypothetical protein